VSSGQALRRQGIIFVDFEEIWGAYLGPFWQLWGSLLSLEGVWNLKIGVFWGSCCEVSFFSDFGSDSGVPGT